MSFLRVIVVQGSWIRSVWAYRVIDRLGPDFSIRFDLLVLLLNNDFDTGIAS